MEETSNKIPDFLQLKKHSFIAYSIERFFRFLQLYHPSGLILGNRPDFQKELIIKPKEQQKSLTITRARKVELYICLCIILEIILVFAISFLPKFNIIWSILIILRIVDIIQVTINLNIFDQLRADYQMVMASVIRTLVLSILNYFELIFCFSIIYYANIHNLDQAYNWFDTFYFSSITQLTIGYGDIKPQYFLKTICAFQGMFGLLFTVFILGRFVSLLPQISTVFSKQDDKKSNEY